MTGFAAYWSLLPLLQPAWHMSNTMAGWLSGAFFGGYVLAVPFLTATTDRVDARYVVILGAVLSSAALVGLALFATGFWSALPWRVLAGAGLAGTYMPGLKVLTDRVNGGGIMYRRGGVKMYHGLRRELVRVVHGRAPRAGRRALRAAGGGPRVGGACGPTRSSGVIRTAAGVVTGSA